MTDPATTISSDLRSPRTGTPIDDAGQLAGIEIRIDGKAHTIVYGDRGGVVVVAAPLDTLMRPTAEEGGISRRLQDVLRRLADIEVADFDAHEGTMIDKLEAAIAEFSEYASNIRPDLAVQEQHVEQLEEALRKCCRIALDRTTSSAFAPEDVRWQAAAEEVEKLAALCLSWQDGARVLYAAGLVDSGAAAGATTFFADLRRLLEHCKATQEALEGQTHRDTAALNMSRGELAGMRGEATAARQSLLEIIGGEPLPTVPGEHTLSLLGRIAAEKVERLATQLADAAADRARLEKVNQRLEAQINGEKMPDDIGQRATDAAISVLDTLAPTAAGAEPHKVRAHLPGAGILRVIVAADVADDVFAEIADEVQDKAGEFVESVSIEREPGAEPEGYRIEGGEDGGQPAYVWHHVALQEAGHTQATKAAAIDGAWTAYAEGLTE